MGRPSSCNCFCVKDCLGCSPAETTNPDLAKYVYADLSGVAWGMPTSHTGSVGPFKYYRPNPPYGNYDTGWQCPEWGPTVDGIGDCGLVEVENAEVNWRLDAVDPAGFNGEKKGVRINPATNKCSWSWSQGKVANIYVRGTIIGEDDVYPGVLQVASVEPEFRVELHDLVAGAMEGTMADPGTDTLNATACSDLGRPLRQFKFFPVPVGTDSTLGTVGWKNQRITFGLGWSVSAVNSLAGYRWQLSCGVSWVWTVRNTGRWAIGSFPVPNPYGSTTQLSQIGQFATNHGVDTSVTPGPAGVRIFGAPGSFAFIRPTCYSGDNRWAEGASWTCEAPTEEIVKKLPTTPSSTPPGHRLYGGPYSPSYNWNNGLGFSYLSDSPVNCLDDLFGGSSISMTLTPDPTFGQAYEDTYGLTPPETATIRFSNA